jgi:hypothetical protein
MSHADQRGSPCGLGEFQHGVALQDLGFDLDVLLGLGDRLQCAMQSLAGGGHGVVEILPLDGVDDVDQIQHGVSRGGLVGGPNCSPHTSEASPLTAEVGG